MKTLTKKQKLLMACLKAYGLDKESGVGVMLYLKEEPLQDKMLDWMRSHTTASPNEVLESAWQIASLL